MVVHRQTTARFAIAPVTWDDIPVGHDVLPDENLHDIARWYNDIHDQWEDITWWLCRIHVSSRASRLPVLACTNYVLVHENDFLAADMRPHGLIELVFGEDQFLFPTFLPRWINWPTLQTFLAPLGPRLVRCANGFFIQVHYASTPFLLSELFHSAPLHAVTLHTVTEYPSERDVRWSVVYIPGGNSLIFSRSYERVDVHSKVFLTGGLHKRFPDLTTENFDLVKVHNAVNMLDPVVNHAKLYYALVYIEEDPVDVVVVLRLDLPPYEDIGAIFVPQILTKSWLVMQTGIDLVCGPEGEVCACYHNGYELPGGEETTVYDGDFFLCWLDPEPKEATVAIMVNDP